MIHVLATIELAPGKREEFLQHFYRLMPVVWQEQGCIEYKPAVDVKTNIAAQGPLRENVVVVLEQWQNIAALEAHLAAPHMGEYREQVKELVESVSLQILEIAQNV